MNTPIPNFLKPYLWSYDTSRMDVEKHAKTIIKAVLASGDKQATDWLFATYPKQVICDLFASTYRGEYDRKSLKLWQTVFDVRLKSRSEVISNSVL